MRAVYQTRAILCHDLPPRDHRLDGECLEVRGQDHIGPPPGRQRPDLAFQPKVGRGVDRRHLQRDQRVAAAVDGMAHHAVHMTVIHQGAGMAVIGAQDHVARIQAFFGDRGDLCFNVIPRGPQPDHRPHPLTHPCNGIRLAGALVIIRRAARHIGRECGPQIGGGIVPAHGLSRALRCGNLGQHLGVARGHTREVHHLAQTDDTGPVHGLGDILCRDFKAGGFQTGRGWRTGRHLGEDVHRLHQGFVMHHAHAFQPQHIGDLMRVGEHRRGAMGDHSAGKFRRCQHAAFDVHMPVTQAGDHIAALCLDHLGRVAFAMAGVRPDKGNAARLDRDIMVRQGFTRVHVDPDTAGDNRIRSAASCRNSDQLIGHIGP